MYFSHSSVQRCGQWASPLEFLESTKGTCDHQIEMFNLSRGPTKTEVTHRNKLDGISGNLRKGVVARMFAQKTGRSTTNS